MRIRIVKDNAYYRKGDVINVLPDEGKLLIKEGIAIKSKDIVSTDIRIK